MAAAHNKEKIFFFLGFWNRTIVKEIFLLAYLLLFSLNYTVYGQKSEALTEVKYFGTNPGNLKMFLHYSVKSDTAKIPLIIVLHGCGENAKTVSELTGWNKLADTNNFAVLYPQQKISNNPNLCFNWFNSSDIIKNQGECGSIYQMITYTIKHFGIDSSRIFIAGLSAGAAMSIVMAANYPELFKCVASFAGVAYNIAENSVESIGVLSGKKNISREKLVNNITALNSGFKGQYPKLIVYQGMNDNIVNCRNADHLVNQWTGIHDIDTIPDKINLSYLGFDALIRQEYSDSAGNVEIILYRVNDMGHILLVCPGNRSDQGGKTGIFGKNIGYHSTYQTAKEFGILVK